MSSQTLTALRVAAAFALTLNAIGFVVASTLSHVQLVHRTRWLAATDNVYVVLNLWLAGVWFWAAFANPDAATVRDLVVTVLPPVLIYPGVRRLVAIRAVVREVTDG